MASALVSYWGRKDVGHVFAEPSVIAGELRSLNDFPDEILLKILSHFEPEDLCFLIAKVCERWNALAKDVILWKTLSYKCDRSSDISRIAEVLREAPALHSLIIKRYEDAADILEFLFRNCSDLRKLILKSCDLGVHGTGLLANIVAFYPDLEVLSLEGCGPLGSTGYCLISRLKKLSELNLSHCENLNGKTVRFIADSCQHLKKFILYYVTDIFDDDVIHVITKLGKQLTTLVLDGTNLTDVAFSFLKNCPRLQKLGLSFCDEMTDRGLLEGIGSLQELTSLRLRRGYKLTAQALSTFLHRPSMTSLVLLNLSECSNLDDEGLFGIAKRCIHLKALAVCFCWKVTDAGISMVISHCSQLRMLYIGGREFIAGKDYTTLVLSHLPNLRRLDVVQRDVCDEYSEELVAALPELVVVHEYGDIVVAVKNRPTNSSNSKDADAESSDTD